jgi:peptidoglycan/xylan/chitin deacetylase (PgdA/CDA1 family)
MKKLATWASIVLVGALMMTGCSANGNENVKDANSANESQVAVNENSENVEEMPEKAEETAKEISSETNEKSNVETAEIEKELSTEEKIANIDLSKKPNELGKIMVLMYHNIGEKEDVWVRTPDNFRQDLERLYNEGYRPIRLSDYVNNEIDVEAGYTPIVITFDDGNQNNFNIIGEKDGIPEIDPNCAVGIMDAFNKEHPDFNGTADFFLFGTNPFGQEEYVEYKLNYLVENGYDVGNHTMSHVDFKSSKYQNAEAIQKALAVQVQRLENEIKDESYRVNTLALPYGHRPKTDALQKFLAKGSYDGTEYENVAVLNVGWDPYYSPVDKRFDQTTIHRIRAGVIEVDNVGILDWLESFEKHPTRKYISDGEKDIITIPARLKEQLDESKINGKAVNVYDEN